MKTPDHSASGSEESIFPNPKIEEAVREGEAEFYEFATEKGIILETQVHNNEDMNSSVEHLQSSVTGITSPDNPEEIRAKTFFIYGIHAIDDPIDNEHLLEKYGGYDELFKRRHDINLILEMLRETGQLGHEMARRSKHPEAMYTGIHKVTYGGLIPRARSIEEAQILLQEYKDLGIQHVEPAFAEVIKELSPTAFWTTNKAIMESVLACEEEFDWTLAEILNCMIGPVMFYQNLNEETAAGEFGPFAPKVNEQDITKMILSAHSFLKDYPDPRKKLRLKQLDVILQAFLKRSSDTVKQAYQQTRSY
jgi:hypothetical protein